MSADARAAVLNRIRIALKDGGPTDPAAISAEWVALPRAYGLVQKLSFEARLDLFEDRLRDYDAEVTRVSDPEVARMIESVLAALGNPKTLLPHGFASSWLPAGNNVTIDEGFSPLELDRYGCVITGATVAIAETGSLVLQEGPGQGRRAATLIPDFLLCVVRAQDVVATVPEAFARIAATSTLPTTFVSGPSATADIEMTRIKGVHGPRFLHVIIVVN